jgi:diadenosine tetraphosphate (Ap4A) HIT family hydrolase
MSVVAEAVYKVFNPVKLNYELLGNTDSHMHWHFFPRYKDDPNPEHPTWVYDRKKRCNPQTKPTNTELASLKEMLNSQLSKILT